MITVRMRTSVGTLRKSSIVLLRDDRARQLVAANLADIIQGEQPDDVGDLNHWSAWQSSSPGDVQQGEAGDGPPKPVTRARSARRRAHHGDAGGGKAGDVDNPASSEPGQGHLTD